jgi:hypothetical protein
MLRAKAVRDLAGGGASDTPFVVLAGGTRGFQGFARSCGAHPWMRFVVASRQGSPDQRIPNDSLHRAGLQMTAMPTMTALVSGLYLSCFGLSIWCGRAAGHLWLSWLAILCTMGMASKRSCFPGNPGWCGASADVEHARLSFVDPSIWIPGSVCRTRSNSSGAVLLGYSATANVADDSGSIRVDRGGVDKCVDSSRLNGYQQTLADWLVKCSSRCIDGGTIYQFYRALFQSFAVV